MNSRVNARLERETVLTFSHHTAQHREVVFLALWIHHWHSIDSSEQKLLFNYDPHKQTELKSAIWETLQSLQKVCYRPTGRSTTNHLNERLRRLGAALLMLIDTVWMAECDAWIPFKAWRPWLWRWSDGNRWPQVAHDPVLSACCLDSAGGAGGEWRRCGHKRPCDETGHSVDVH